MINVFLHKDGKAVSDHSFNDRDEASAFINQSIMAGYTVYSDAWFTSIPSV